MTPQCPFKLPAGIGTVIDRPVPERKPRSFLGFSASPPRPTKLTTGQVAAASQSIARALRGCARALRRYGKGLVLCKEKTLRDKVGVIVIIDTRANSIAKKSAKKLKESVEIEL